jgi:hypothetical protein
MHALHCHVIAGGRALRGSKGDIRRVHILNNKKSAAGMLWCWQTSVYSHHPVPSFATCDMSSWPFRRKANNNNNNIFEILKNMQMFQHHI